MAKMKTSIFLIGALILVLITAISTYLILLLTNVIPKDPIKIELTIVDKEKPYDGTPLMADEYRIDSGNLLKGHSLVLDYIGSITDSGTIKSNASCHVYDNDHTDHTSEYVFTIHQGNLTITKKQVTLSVKNKTLDYKDNDDFNKNCEYEITAGGICSGHTVKPTYKIEAEDFENNEILASLTADIYDINGVNVTKNYSIDYENGIVGINKTRLVFKTISKTKVYDGEAFDNDDFGVTLDYGTLPQGYTYDCLYDYSAKGDVGSTSLGVTSIRILDNTGDDVTEKFDVTVIPDGILTINPVEIDIAVSDHTVEYDGEDHSFNEFEIKSDALISPDTSDKTKFTYNNYNYTISALSSTKVRNAGSYVNIINFVITDKYNEDVTSNFRINQDKAILTINKKNTIIYGDNYIGEYDETKHKIINETPEKTQGLLSGHVVTVQYSSDSELTNAGSVATDILSYKIVDENDNDVTQNYNVTTVSGLLTVTKQKIEIIGKILDDKSLVNYYYGDVNFNTEELKAVLEFKSKGDQYSLDAKAFNYTQIKHVGVYDVLPTDFDVKIGSDIIADSKLINYELVISPVTINIKKTSVFITVESRTVEREDAGTVRLSYDIEMQDDIGDFEDDFEVSVSTMSIDTVGTYFVGVTFTNSDDESSIDDYSVYITPGILTVVEP